MNWGIEVLQTSALPLGYGAMVYGMRQRADLFNYREAAAVCQGVFCARAVIREHRAENAFSARCSALRALVCGYPQCRTDAACAFAVADVTFEHVVALYADAAVGAPNVGRFDADAAG